jgi:hypothetical protein
MERESLRKIADFMGIYIHKRTVKDERTGDLFWRVGVGDGNKDLPTFLTRFDDYEEAERFIDQSILLFMKEGE